MNKIKKNLLENIMANFASDISKNWMQYGVDWQIKQKNDKDIYKQYVKEINELFES